MKLSIITVNLNNREGLRKATQRGWTYHTELEEGICLTYQDFLNNPIRAER